ncbi:MAG: phosphate ABC transporter permease PstA [Roseiflexus sp.]|nr:phosphate ABC transporter permease PstA [Roseiflexus sp.]MCS7288211.1 phosphate ABC transporter permease PstA [Roseiflexus sp.]MDW8145932.1 phosphate ABC transporter permease PstA [Roseiflexaceae bacterium]MDW8232845.1 phosphate ABC transporter permease PstA [Roseiflexaceae bacterium]
MSLKSSVSPNYARRKAVDLIMRGLVLIATGLAIVPLVLIIGYVMIIGGSALNWEFFTDIYQPPMTVSMPNTGPIDPNDPFANLDLGALVGSEPATGQAGAGDEKGADILEAPPRGGVLHGIVGTMLITTVALLIAMPIGIMAGIFLSEFPDNSVATTVRFACDVLSGAPSIIVGVTAYILIVNAKGPDGQPLGFTGIAGSIALTFLMVPTITRTTEEVLKLVPEATREAALAMGATTWYSTFTVVVPTALSGIVTGIMLAFARGAGETAPLIMTVLGSNVLMTNLLEPMAALPLITYRYTESPFPSENTLAWGSAFVLMMLVLLVNILVRIATRNRLRMR